MAKKKIDYAELCDVLRIKVNAARAQHETHTGKTGKGLSEPSTAVADTGVRIGDPRAGEGRRTAEIDGAFQRGTVKVPVKGDNGRTKLEERPGTEDNVKAALAYWKSRKPRTDSSRQTQRENVSTLTRRLEAMMAHQTVRYDQKTRTLVATGADHTPMRADQSPEGRTRHTLAGPALVQGPNMAPVQPMRRNSVTGAVEPKAARLDGALTERLDRTVADPRDKGRRTASQRKNWRRKQQRLALKAAQVRIAELEAKLAAQQ